MCSFVFSPLFLITMPIPKSLHSSVSIIYFVFFLFSLFFSLHTYSDQDEVEQGKGSTEPQRRKLSSSSNFLPGNPEKPHVLAQVCIVCNKKDRWSREKISRKTVRDKYSQCQTVTAGQLLEAARQKKDERLLMQIENKDLIALEVCYHRLCYNEYTRFLTRYIRVFVYVKYFHMRALSVRLNRSTIEAFTSLFVV